MKVISNYRYWVLFFAGAVAVLGTFSAPQDNLPMLSWLYILVTSKVIGFLAWACLYALYSTWHEKGYLNELGELTEE